MGLYIYATVTLQRALRGICLGRKSWLFAGSDRGGACCPFRESSIRESYASSCYGGGEAGPVVGAGGEADEVEPAQVVVQIAGGDAAAGTQEVLQPAVAAVHRLHMQIAPNPFPHRAVECFVALLAGAVLFVTAALPNHGTISVGDFLVVYTAFMVFQAAVTRLGASFGAVAAIVPAIDRIRPFLTEVPETTAAGEPVETLGGDIVFDHVSFRYDAHGPLILDDVSIHARPGEFVAIAGESGAGKSTLFRLALGLDEPTSGAVYYDGRDLGHLNIKQVRRRIGAVPQAVQLHPEDVWDNIVGDYEDATAEDAWRAAKLAGIDREISAMPMGMLTSVGAGAGVTSGGESQRIMIAHALLRNPGVLLLDEATNWLDNSSQAQVMQNLGSLTSTRIVIAHRLSTLRQADRIYVMQAGRVVQEGTYAELVETEGVFRNLVRRQMA